MSYKTKVEELHTYLKGEGHYQFQGELHDDHSIAVAGELVGVDASTGKIKHAPAYSSIATFVAEYCGVASREMSAYSAADELTYDRKMGVFAEAPCEFVLKGGDLTPKVFDMVAPVLTSGAIERNAVQITTDYTQAIGYVRQTFPLTTDIEATTTRVLVWIKGRRTHIFGAPAEQSDT